MANRRFGEMLQDWPMQGTQGGKRAARSKLQIGLGSRSFDQTGLAIHRTTRHPLAGRKAPDASHSAS